MLLILSLPCAHISFGMYMYVFYSANDPVCIIQVEPLHTHTSVVGDCNLMAGIQSCNLCVRKSENEDACLSGSSGQCGAEEAGNECSFFPCSKQSASDNCTDRAVIMGVLRQRDVPKSWLQSFPSYLSTGLHVPLTSSRYSWLKSKPNELLQGSVTFSREYQNLCLGLASNELLLVSNVCVYIWYSTYCAVKFNKTSLILL